jgi:hypothetical protein
MRKRNLFYAFAVTPLLMGASGSKVSPLTVDRLPVCNDAAGEYLVYQSGGLTCRTVSGGGGFATPDCTNAQQPGPLLTSTRGTGDIAGVSCTPRGQSGGAIDVTRLVDIEKKITDLTTLITTIENTPASGISTFAGNTTMSYNGNFVAASAGSDNGFVGAAKVCEAQYGAGAHMCTSLEIYESAVKGVIGSTKNIAKAWVYFPAWNNPVAGSNDPLQGQGDTCGSLTYPTGDLRWTGIAVSTGALRTTRWGVRFHGGSEAPCNAPLPIACCK